MNRPGFRPAAAAAALLAAVLATPSCAPSAPGPADDVQEDAAEAEAVPEPVVFPAQNRPDVRGTTAAVSSDHPLASAVGHDVLRRGGNAVDAAVAMAAVLAVVRPHMNGVGGDAFALIHEAESGRQYAMNGSGRAGALATPVFFIESGHASVPENGPLSVTAPGAVAAWMDALERFGTMPRDEVLAPAIRYARDGFPVSTRLREDMAAASGVLNGPARDLYVPGGQAPPAGTLLKNPALARTLERIAREGAAGFYRGPVAERIGDFLEAEGGYLRAPDLAAHATTWVEPLRGEYAGYEFLVLPPNTQGIAQLQLMEMAKSHDIEGMGHNTSSYLHTLIELKKLAFADRDRWVADPEHVEIPTDRLLDPVYLAARAALVDPAAAAQAREPGVGGEAPTTDAGDGAPDDSGDTVYLTVVDRWGNAVSWIQSLFASFGSGLLEPETGVVLHNRGALFTLDPAHPNVIAPGKRPYHTLTPTMALRDGRLGLTLGTPGGDSQVQSLLQIVNNLALFGMTPQQAIEAPRFRGYGGLAVALEDRIDPGVRAELARLGHEVRVVHDWTATFGGAQMILVEENGSLTVASDPRREAYGIAY